MQITAHDDTGHPCQAPIFSQEVNFPFNQRQLRCKTLRIKEASLVQVKFRKASDDVCLETSILQWSKTPQKTIYVIGVIFKKITNEEPQRVPIMCHAPRKFETLGASFHGDKPA